MLFNASTMFPHNTTSSVIYIFSHFSWRWTTYSYNCGFTPFLHMKEGLYPNKKDFHIVSKHYGTMQNAKSKDNWFWFHFQTSREEGKLPRNASLLCYAEGIRLASIPDFSARWHSSIFGYWCAAKFLHKTSGALGSAETGESVAKKSPNFTRFEFVMLGYGKIMSFLFRHISISYEERI